MGFKPGKVSMSKTTTLMSSFPISQRFDFKTRRVLVNVANVGWMNETLVPEKATRLYRVDLYVSREAFTPSEHVAVDLGVGGLSYTWGRLVERGQYLPWSGVFRFLRERMTPLFGGLNAFGYPAISPLATGDKESERIIRAIRSEISHRPSLLGRGGEI